MGEEELGRSRRRAEEELEARLAGGQKATTGSEEVETRA